jgi:hypothetical protein
MKMKSLIAIMAATVATTVLGQNITGVSPNTTHAGSTVTVTMTINPSATPRTPPLNVSPSSMTIGSVSGTNISRLNTECTATFVVPAGETSGLKDCTITFNSSGISYTLVGGFAVTGGTTPVVGGTVTNTQPVAGLYPIVDTAQTDFYNASSTISAPSTNDAFYGQDGQYVGRQPSYTVSGDGLTVYDNVTGLTWTQSHDWNGDGDLDADDKMTQANAAAFVATLNAANYGGFSDWRLPSIKEIYSLMDFNGTDPSIDAIDTTGLTPFIDDAVFTIGYGDYPDERIIDSQFAVTTLYVDTVMGGQEAMFGLNLVDGRIKGYPTLTGKGYYALFCRGNTAYGVNHFSNQGNGTVSDAATGLMWAQADSGSAMDWEDALAYAEASTLAGHADWRLPNAKELQSLIDYTRSPSTTGSAAIDPLFSATQITNMAGDADYPWYWSGTTHLKYTGSAAYGVYVCFGRGMGTMDSGATIIDVHGAGCQRSDPKSGDPADYPNAGNGPQGDVSRVFNHVRLVRDSEGSAPDSDGDSMTDSDEIFVGTDPADAGSVLEMQLNGQTLSWPHRYDRTYVVEGSSNLLHESWFTVGNTTSSNYLDSTEYGAIFYRLRVEKNMP